MFVRNCLAVAGLFFVALILACVGCGSASGRSRQPSISLSDAVQTPDSRCPPTPSVNRRTASLTTLVAGHPTTALICRYVRPLARGSLAHYHVVDALRVSRETTVEHMVRKLDALPAYPSHPAPSCPASGDRSDLIIFGYRAGGEARVTITEGACAPVSNGRLVRFGLGLVGRDHWPDEALL
jgi:hypothetical protein